MPLPLKPRIFAFALFCIVISISHFAHSEDDGPQPGSPQIGDSSVSLDFQTLGGVKERLAPHGNNLMDAAEGISKGVDVLVKEFS